MKFFCVDNLFERNKLGLLNMLDRDPTSGSQGFQLLCWFLLSKLPPFPNTPQCPAQGKPLLKYTLFSLHPNLFYFSEKCSMFCWSAIWALWHVRRVIASSGCNCHCKAFNKFTKQHQDEGTNGLGDGQLIIWDYLTQLEPFHTQDTQPVPSIQTNLWGFSEFWLLPAIKPPHKFISNTVKENIASPPHLPNGWVYHCVLLQSFALNAQPILEHHDILTTGHPFPASTASPRRDLKRPFQKSGRWSELYFLIP